MAVINIKQTIYRMSNILVDKVCKHFKYAPIFPIMIIYQSSH